MDLLDHTTVFILLLLLLLLAASFYPKCIAHARNTQLVGRGPAGLPVIKWRQGDSLDVGIHFRSSSADVFQRVCRLFGVYL